MRKEKELGARASTTSFRRESMSMVWPTLGSRKAKEQNRTATA